MLRENEHLRELTLGNEGTMQDFECKFSIYSLCRLKVDRLTYNYASLTSWCEFNAQLTHFKMKYPWLSLDPHESRPFLLSFLNELQVLNISGLFSEVNLQSLPSLKHLKIKHRRLKIKLTAFPGTLLCLSRLAGEINSEDVIKVTHFEI